MAERIYIGIDYGERRIGLARSDPTGLIATAYKTIINDSPVRVVARILDEIASLDAMAVIVGYPVAPDGGTAGERCRMVDDFIARLEKKYPGPVYRVDERGTSAEAENIIHKHGKKIGRKKGRVDRLAAAIILQRFLDEKKN